MTMKNQMQMRQIAIDRTPVERQLRQRLRSAPLGRCLTFEQFLELAKRGQRATGYYEQMTHIISCPACRRAYLELRVILKAQRPSLARWLSRLTTPRLPQWTLATGFAGVVFAFAVWALYPKPASNTLIASNPPAPKVHSGAQSNAPTTPPNSQIAQLPQNPTVPKQEKNQRVDSEQKPKSGIGTATHKKVGNGRGVVIAKKQPSQNGGNGSQSQVPQTKQGRSDRTQIAQKEPGTPSPQPSGAAKMQGSPLEQELASVGRLLSQGAESLSRTLASLAQGRAVRGGRSAQGVQQITVLQPDLRETDLLEDTTVTLQWEPVAGATQYIVVLRRRDTGETLLGEELPATQIQLQLRSLAPGGEYELILSAPRGERATLKTVLSFQVMSDAQRAQLRWARQNVSKAPLVAGLLFYQLERYREAVDALEKAQQLYPDDEEVSRALQNLRARTRR
jgi:hypothetical protein